MAIAVHAAILYGSALAAVVAALATRRRRGDPAPSPGRVVAMLSPFLAIGLAEALMLCADGHMLLEWALPMTAALVVTAGSRDGRLIRVARALLVAVALGAWVHGRSLLHHGYTTHPRAFLRGTHLESGWYTPLLGLRKVVR
jgi:hypothetical protein